MSKSHKKVWWGCKKGHSWKARIADRTSKGNGCPFCSGRRAHDEICLATVKPWLAKEWDSTKNRKLTPKDVTSKSHKSIWWKCLKGHSWRARVSYRAQKGSGCPYCSGKRKIKISGQLKLKF